jgi:hypothetical protein
MSSLLFFNVENSTNKEIPLNERHRYKNMLTHTLMLYGGIKCSVVDMLVLSLAHLVQT